MEKKEEERKRFDFVGVKEVEIMHKLKIRTKAPSFPLFTQLPWSKFIPPMAK